MSLASRITLSLACISATGIIAFVHYTQYAEHKKLQEGISKDLERQESKKVEKMYWIDKQLEVTEMLKKEQSEHGKITIPVMQDLRR